MGRPWARAQTLSLKVRISAKKSQVLFSIDCQGQVPDLRSVAYRNLSLTKAAP